MPGRINEIQLVATTVLAVVIQRDALRLDRDAAFTLDIERIKHLLVHLTFLQAATGLDEAICQGGFAMVDVRDDGKIADVA